MLGRDTRKQLFNDETAKLASGTGDNDHGMIPESG
ncbi:hypothetical protein PSYAC_19908 [Pseudomonas syringae pv. actinidiae str. M302091]|nr:hypothetical protein PSYAC_19908 [Pseudomonas syringae pv. actinidiae str. M302091]